MAVSCPKCGRGLIVRENRYDGRKFLACPGYPGCRYTESMPTNSNSHSGKNESKREFNPTEEGKLIFDDILNGECHVFVQAGPGCGKSKNSRESLFSYLDKFPKARTVYTCFNRSIATEFSKECPRETLVSTMHALGNGILRSVFPELGKPLTKKGEKTNAIIDMMADYDKVLRTMLDDEVKGPILRSAIVDLTSHCKGHLFDGSNKDELQYLCDRFGIEGKDAMPFIATVIERSKTFTINGALHIDFDDMVWMPVILDLPFNRADLVVIDEGQDLNRVKQVFAMRLAGKGRIIFIGDRNQAINGFTGADCYSMQTMARMLKESDRCVSERTLSITFRCPKSHVRFLNQQFPNNPLRCLETQREGSIEEIGTDQILERIQARDMILCRVNAPLVSWFFKLLKVKKRAIIIGRRDEVETLVSAIKALKGRTIPDLLKKIEKARQKEIKRLQASGKPALHLIEATEDKFEILREIATACSGVGEIEPTIRSMFEEAVNDDRIRLSSVHRAKGMESDGVFILHPELIPHPKASSEEELMQEENIGWVAYSRSKDRMYIVR